MVGENFGNLIVIEKSEKKRNETTLWKCKCILCNKEFSRLKSELLREEYNCRCTLVTESIIGNQYNKWKVLSFSHKDRQVFYFKCQCECGLIKNVRKGSLVGGQSKSCGCFKYKIGNQNKLWKGFGEISGVYWNEIIKSANRREIEFNIDIKHAWELFIQQNRKCSLTGRLLIFSKRDDESNTRTSSLDRINSDIGYIKGNIQWVHKDINFMKQQFSQEYFIKTCEEITIYQQQERKSYEYYSQA